jgi:hypothetical protein
MRAETGFQSSHSDWVHVIAKFMTPNQAKELCQKTLDLLRHEMRRSNRRDKIIENRKAYRVSREQMEKWLNSTWRRFGDEDYVIIVSNDDDTFTAIVELGLELCDTYCGEDMQIMRPGQEGERDELGFKVYTGEGGKRLKAYLEERGAPIIVVECETDKPGIGAKRNFIEVPKALKENACAKDNPH